MTNKNRRYLLNHLLEVYSNRRTRLYSQGKPCIKYSIDDGSKNVVISIELKPKT